MSDYLSLETKKLFAAAQISQEGASKEIDEYLSTFNFPTNESKKLTRVALLNYCGAAILMPYSLFHKECKELKYDYKELFEEDLTNTDYNTKNYDIYYDSSDDTFYMENVANSHKFIILGHGDSVVIGLEYITCQFKQFIS